MNPAVDHHRAELLLPLDAGYLRSHSTDEAMDAIARIVCSVRFEMLPEERAFRLLGPEMSYHSCDPYLLNTLARWGIGPTSTDILEYRVSTPHYDLCLEDSWTSFFISSRFERQRDMRDLLLVHLDDHTDMMPTLLESSEAGLTDPATGLAFDPMSSHDWISAIASGAVNIGNYITPMFYSDRHVHVRHLNNKSAAFSEGLDIVREPCSYALIPDRRFADIERSAASRMDRVGSYRAGDCPDHVLTDLPQTWTIVHIDLDYFINDFDGASKGQDYVPDPGLRDRAELKMRRFFDAMRASRLDVDRWLIGTSPGFCSAYHWEWLIENIERGIRAL